jgi:hypothetical protein
MKWVFPCLWDERLAHDTPTKMGSARSSSFLKKRRSFFLAGCGKTSKFPVLVVICGGFFAFSAEIQIALEIQRRHVDIGWIVEPCA